MRSKTFVLGSSVAALFFTFMVSARPLPTTPDTGYGVGEKLPSIKVDDTVSIETALNEGERVLVLWSKSDAVSRLVNARISKLYGNDGVISICVDAPSAEARRCSSIDGVDSCAIVSGTDDSGSIIRLLGMKKGLKTFKLNNGVVKEVTANQNLWQDFSDPSGDNQAVI